ncbi:MAG: tRNA pseudouridine(55) synthase TruB [Rhodospirillales bacterium]|nr:tRNA pseudouridine(55) synthase TruB [Rhodospirillales bacterium]
MARRKSGEPINGWLVIDKPLEVTSTQTVSRVRRLFNARKAGHGGTLDPLASGVLPIALGEAAKTVGYAMDLAKRYRFTLRWGQATSTDDAEGTVVEESLHRPSIAEIEAVLPSFRGVISQTPPVFSAVKIAGKRAYDLARNKGTVALDPRQVRIDALELAEQPDRDRATFLVDCGKGAYMRALARDLGRVLGTCAHVVALRRTAVGPFNEDMAISLESLEALRDTPALMEQMLPIETALDDIPAFALSEAETRRLRCGQTVSLMARVHRDRLRDLSQGSIVCATAAGKLVALARYEAGEVHPVRVINQ